MFLPKRKSDVSAVKFYFCAKNNVSREISEKPLIFLTHEIRKYVEKNCIQTYLFRKEIGHMNILNNSSHSFPLKPIENIVIFMVKLKI